MLTVYKLWTGKQKLKTSSYSSIHWNNTQAVFHIKKMLLCQGHWWEKSILCEVLSHLQLILLVRNGSTEREVSQPGVNPKPSDRRWPLSAMCCYCLLCKSMLIRISNITTVKRSVDYIRIALKWTMLSFALM